MINPSEVNNAIRKSMNEIRRFYGQWQPIETAPKENCTRILAAGPYRRDGSIIMGIVYWNTVFDWVEVSVGDGLYRKEKHIQSAYWAPDDYRSALDFEPTYWMPLPKPPEVLR